MNEIIKIEKRDGFETVNARELHSFLQVGRDFSSWIKQRIEKYGFIEDEDYAIFSQSPNPGTGNRGVLIEYSITLDMAKELSMVENNDKGKEARKYFIDCEKQLRQPKKLTGQALLAAAVIEAQRTIETQTKKIESMKPAVQFMEDVTGSKSALSMSEAAKIIDAKMGRNKLFLFLRENKILRENNEPYQSYIDKGWFRVIEQKYESSPGETQISIKTLVYQKGIDGIIKKLRSNS